MKWVYLATAPNQLEAEMWREMLVDEGFTVVVREGDTNSYMGMSNYPCRILVSEDQHSRASEVLDERLGPTPESDRLT